MNQDQYIDHRFYQRVSLAVITHAINEAQTGSFEARNWLTGQYVGLWTLGAGMEPDYVRRITLAACKASHRKDIALLLKDRQIREKKPTSLII